MEEEGGEILIAAAFAAATPAIPMPEAAAARDPAPPLCAALRGRGARLREEVDRAGRESPLPPPPLPALCCACAAASSSPSDVPAKPEPAPPLLLRGVLEVEDPALDDAKREMARSWKLTAA